MSGNEAIFTEIYTSGAWGDKESLSGAGSSLEYTQNLRSQLPILVEKFGIKSIFDSPCGDFNWMRHVLQNAEMQYIGGDIVKPLIHTLNTNYGNSKTRFFQFDITTDSFPYADLWISRDCWFHLTYKDIYSALQQYIWSNIPYLLTTTHINQNEFVNMDIPASGGFRMIDLFSAPFNFPANPLCRIEDWIEGFPKREMCLWSREQIIAATVR